MDSLLPPRPTTVHNADGISPTDAGPAVAAAALLQYWAVGNGVLLLSWDGAPAPAAEHIGVRIGDTMVMPPFCRDELPLEDGGSRNLLGLVPGCRMSANAAITVCDETGAPIATSADGAGTGTSAGTETSFGEPAASEQAVPECLDPLALLDGTTAASLEAFARFLFEVCGPTFRLGRDPLFVALCNALLDELTTVEQPLSGRCLLLDRYLLATCEVPSEVRGPFQAYVLSGAMVTPAPFAPARIGSGSGAQHTAVGLFLPAAAAGGDVRVVVFGDCEMALARSHAASASLPTAGDWLITSHGDGKPLRRFVVECLANLSASSEDAAALLREIWLCLAGGGFSVTDPAQPVAAGTTWILGSEAGLFVSGWMRDRYHLAAGLEAERDGVRAFVPLHHLVHCSPPDCGNGDQDGADHPLSEGRFAAFFAYDGPAPAATPCRLALRLKSGTRLTFADGPSAVDAQDAHALILDAFAPAQATDAALGACIEPALEAFAAEVGRTPLTWDTIDLRGGPAKPAVSVVIPLTERSSVLRCRAGQFATDPAMADVEVIFTAADPRTWWRVEACARDLLASYAQGARVVVASRPCRHAEALNAGASIARAPLLTFCGADSVPEERGWIAKLKNSLATRRQFGLVGARILFEDQSLAHAGADLSLDERGAWAVQPRLAGFPRDFAGATGAGPVPVVSSACLMMQRALFEDVDGFSDDYLRQTYADADLCFKVRSTGAAVWHAADVIVFALGDRHGLSEDAGGLPLLLDRRRLTCRWRGQVDLGDDAGDEPAAADDGTDGRRPRRLKVHS
ncbi:MAG: hypothetical protein WAS73_16485 [Defluviicoccus sp.]